MNIGKWRILAASVTLICSLAIPVLAIEYFWRTDVKSVNNGIVINAYPTPTLAFGLYFDSACTVPATVIDYGEMIHPQGGVNINKIMWIRNEGDNWLIFYWSSTLKEIAPQFSEWWFPNGTRVEADGIIPVTYTIVVPAYAAIGTYNWTLTVWGEHWY